MINYIQQIFSKVISTANTKMLAAPLAGGSLKNEHSQRKNTAFATNVSEFIKPASWPSDTPKAKTDCLGKTQCQTGVRAFPAINHLIQSAFAVVQNKNAQLYQSNLKICHCLATENHCGEDWLQKTGLFYLQAEYLTSSESQQKKKYVEKSVFSMHHIMSL